MIRKIKTALGLTDRDPSADVPPVLDRTGFEGSLDGAEVIGRSPLSYIDASESVGQMMGKQTRYKLAAYGLEDVRPDEWYSLKAPLAMLYDMREEYSEVTMWNMARNVPEHVEFPPEIDDVATALYAIDEAYHTSHRGGDIGFYEFDLTDESEGTMVCENPYPCDFDRGLIEGVARKFANKPVQIDEIGDQCRSAGGRYCEYRISWI